MAHLALAATPSTRVLTRVRAGGQSIVRLDDRAPRLAADAEVDAEALDAAIRNADAVLVADYGGGVTAHPAVRDVLARWAPRRPVVWDPHPRGAEPVPGVTAATPNRREALTFAPSEHDDLDAAAAQLRERWQARGVVVTDGAAGAVTLLAASPPLFTPAPHASVGRSVRRRRPVRRHAGAGPRPRRGDHRGRRRGRGRRGRLARRWGRRAR